MLISKFTFYLKKKKGKELRKKKKFKRYVQNSMETASEVRNTFLRHCAKVAEASTVMPVYGKMHQGFSEQTRAESSHPCTLV